MQTPPHPNFEWGGVSASELSPVIIYVSQSRRFPQVKSRANQVFDHNDRKSTYTLGPWCWRTEGRQDSCPH